MFKHFSFFLQNFLLFFCLQMAKKLMKTIFCSNVSCQVVREREMRPWIEANLSLEEEMICAIAVSTVQREWMIVDLNLKNSLTLYFKKVTALWTFHGRPNIYNYYWTDRRRLKGLKYFSYSWTRWLRLVYANFLSLYSLVISLSVANFVFAQHGQPTLQRNF